MTKIYTELPPNYGECPVCNGTGRSDAGDYSIDLCLRTASYDKATHTFKCYNCGGQSMFSKPVGYVKLNKEGKPCKHSYVGRNAGRCYTWYTCSECGDEYDIDSGD